MSSSGPLLRAAPARRNNLQAARRRRRRCEPGSDPRRARSSYPARSNPPWREAFRQRTRALRRLPALCAGGRGELVWVNERHVWTETLGVIAVEAQPFPRPPQQAKARRQRLSGQRRGGLQLDRRFTRCNGLMDVLISRPSQQKEVIRQLDLILQIEAGGVLREGPLVWDTGALWRLDAERERTEKGGAEAAGRSEISRTIGITDVILASRRPVDISAEEQSMFRSEGVDMASDIDIGGKDRLRALPLILVTLGDRDVAPCKSSKSRNRVVRIKIYIVVGDLLLDRPVLVELMRPGERGEEIRLQIRGTGAEIGVTRGVYENSVDNWVEEDGGILAPVIILRLELHPGRIVDVPFDDRGHEEALGMGGNR